MVSLYVHSVREYNMTAVLRVGSPPPQAAVRTPQQAPPRDRRTVGIQRSQSGRNSLMFRYVHLDLWYRFLRKISGVAFLYSRVRWRSGGKEEGKRGRGTHRKTWRRPITFVPVVSIQSAVREEGSKVSSRCMPRCVIAPSRGHVFSYS